jgi:protein phosphatase 1 regulatory subunit 11
MDVWNHVVYSCICVLTDDASHQFNSFFFFRTRDESVVDNEGMGRKSSKRCCIFHKQRAFGESSTDSSDYEDDNDYDHHEDNEEGHHHHGSGPWKNRKIAHQKNKGASPTKKDHKTPDHLRFHA